MTKESNNQSVIVGIDFGTTNTKVSNVRPDGEVEIVRVNGKDWQTPTAMHLGEDRVEFGARAVNVSVASPDRFMIEFKRQLGEYDNDGDPLVLYVDPKTDQKYSVVELVQQFLAYTKETTENALNASIAAVVVSCPAYFKDPARRQLQQAAQTAGLPLLGLIDEPVAASMAYFANAEKNGKFLVFDLGGGTLDVTLIESQGNAITVLATDGDAELGGCDFDLHLREEILTRFAKDQGFSPDVVDDAQDLHELMTKIRQARHDLSDVDQVSVPVRVRGNHMLFEIDRSEFRKLVQPTVDKTIAVARRCLEKGDLKAENLEAILMVGGSTHMPCIHEDVEKAFGIPIQADKDREFLVAKGAALEAVRRGAEHHELADVIRELPVPDVRVSNKTAHPLCVAVVDSNDPSKVKTVHHSMISAQSSIPASVTDTFTPAEDYQPGVKIDVTQGKHGAPVDSKEIIYSLELHIEPLPRSERIKSVEVTYNFDENSVIHVHGKDLIGGNEAEGRFNLGSDDSQRAA